MREPKRTPEAEALAVLTSEFSFYTGEAFGRTFMGIEQLYPMMIQVRSYNIEN